MNLVLLSGEQLLQMQVDALTQQVEMQRQRIDVLENLVRQMLARDVEFRITALEQCCFEMRRDQMSQMSRFNEYAERVAQKFDYLEKTAKITMCLQERLAEHNTRIYRLEEKSSKP